jgi:hypothetical protein
METPVNLHLVNPEHLKKIEIKPTKKIKFNLNIILLVLFTLFSIFFLYNCKRGNFSQENEPAPYSLVYKF